MSVSCECGPVRGLLRLQGGSCNAVQRSCFTCWCHASMRGRGGQSAVNDPRRRQDGDPGARAACAREGLAARPPCDPFQAMVDQITSHGPLQFNGYTRLVPVGPRLTRAEVHLAGEPHHGSAARHDDAPGWRRLAALSRPAPTRRLRARRWPRWGSRPLHRTGSRQRRPSGLTHVTG